MKSLLVLLTLLSTILIGVEHPTYTASSVGAEQLAASRPPKPTPTPKPSPTPAPTSCNPTTNNPPRWLFESQAWWQDAGTTYYDARHVHLATYFPHAQTICGEVPFHLVLKLHNYPGRVTWIRVQIYQTLKSGTPVCHGSGIVCLDFNPPLVCPDTANGDCTFEFDITVPTQVVAYDGRQEFRFATNLVAQDGVSRMYETTGWQARLANGNPIKDYRSSDFVEARGWYTGANYTNARLNAFPMDTAVAGTWTFGVRLAPGSDGTPVTEYEVLVDPDIHAGSRGIVIKEGTGGSYIGNVSIDTTQLANGPHKLFLRAGSAIAKGINSGVQVVPFTVANP